jgi:hypothetical protein
MRAAYSHASTKKKSASLAFFVRNSLPLIASGMSICMCKLRLTGGLPMACISTILGSNTSVVNIRQIHVGNLICQSWLQHRELWISGEPAA